MNLSKDKKIISPFLSIMALLFYAVSWTVNEYGEAAWYIGVGLPWLSLFVAIITRMVGDIFMPFLL